MANFHNSVPIRTAIEGRSTVDLSADHLTTSDAFRLRPVYINEFAPETTVDINMSMMARLMPLNRPFYGSVKVRNCAFFVPFRIIFDSFNEFYQDTQYVKDGVYTNPTIPYFTNQDLVTLLTKPAFSSEAVDQSTNDFDFQNGAAGHAKHQFTQFGRNVIAILQSLGYQVNFDPSDQSKLSALPLFAFFKIFNDWFDLPAYHQDSRWFDSYRNGGLVSSGALEAIFTDLVAVPYMQDFFTSLWDHPVRPNNSYYPDKVMNDVTVQGTSASVYKSEVDNQQTPGINNQGTPVIRGIKYDQTSYSQYGYAGMISQYALTALKRLTDYMKRKQIPGARVLDRWYAEFGIKYDPNMLKRSQYLGSFDVPLQIGDVMSTADMSETSSSAGLGDFAGKGICFGKDGHFHYKVEEFGLLIITSCIIPKMPINQGRHPFVFHLEHDNFFVPEFDALATVAVRNDQVFAQRENNNAAPSSKVASGVFGYAPCYYEYKTGFDFLSGDFATRRYKDQYASFHTSRHFNDFQTHDAAFCVGDNQLDRLFQADSSISDHFIMSYHFDIKASVPMRSLYDDYDFDGGRSVGVEVNGSRLSN